MPSRLISVTAALVLIGTAFAAPASASEEETNGQITFGRFDPALGDFSICATGLHRS